MKLYFMFSILGTEIFPIFLEKKQKLIVLKQIRDLNLKKV